MTDLTPAQARALVEWAMEEPAVTHSRPYRWFDVACIALIVVVALVVWMCAPGCTAAPRPAGWSDDNAHITVAPDGTMSLCTTVRVLPAE